LLGVFAHPDDDVYQLGGWLAMHAATTRTTLVFATSGDAGPITDGSGATRETLPAVREREQRAAMLAIGADGTTEARFLRHPDYHLPDVPFDALVGQIERIMLETKPQAVVTFGPDGLTSHHDHIRVGEATTAAFDRVTAASLEAPARLYHTALPRSEVDRFYRELASGSAGHGATYGKEGDLFNLTGVPDERIAVAVDTTPVRATKLAGILAHRTQVCEWERIPEPLRWIHLDAERFVQARPERASTTEVASDLFAELA
jgi:LmbE family N-acetylglucosaminyl deacetylase